MPREEHHEIAAGYAHRTYAESLAEFGHPLLLQGSGGYLLRRTVPRSRVDDAMGCYPLFACTRWHALAEDLAGLHEALVSVSLVADPFGDYDLDYLRRCFPDVVAPFKEHVIVDLDGLPFDNVTRHHRRYARAALRKVSVEVCLKPEAMLPTWLALYADFAVQRQVRGIRAFSEPAFALQLRTPGIVMFLAAANSQVVGAHLWYMQGDVSHSHLVMCSIEGRRLRAGFALYWTAMEYFCGRVRWLSLGGAAGTRPAADDGLSRFKRGWSGTTRLAYFCGRILHRGHYAALTAAVANTFRAIAMENFNEHSRPDDRWCDRTWLKPHDRSGAWTHSPCSATRQKEALEWFFAAG